MRIVTAVLALLLSATGVWAQPRLTETARASLVTVGPGDQLYSGFGHSAIRIQDQSLGLDEVFNYGTFDFSDPDFYTKFARGKLLYMLSIGSYEQLERAAIYEGRSVREQELNLTPAQVTRLYQLLIENYHPENRFYHYDFFLDNCATRIRDIVALSVGQDLAWQFPKRNSDISFRELIEPYLREPKPWADFGIDLALGIPCDATAQPEQYMFLPDSLASGFAAARIRRATGEVVPLVKNTRENFLPPTLAEEPALPFTPAQLFWVLGVLGLLYSGWQAWGLQQKAAIKRVVSVLDAVLYAAVGVLGTVLLLLWVATDHAATGPNLNLLWALPLHLPAILLLAWTRAPRLRRMIGLYFVLASILNLLLLVSWPFLPQWLHHSLIPMVLLLAVRGLILYLRLQQRLTADTSTAHA